MARPVHKYANPSPQQIQKLDEIHAHHRLPSHRRRAEALLLSSRGYSAAEIADIIQGHPDTVRRWIDQFDENGVESIADQPREGGKRSLDKSEETILRGLLECYPNRARKVLAELKEQTGKEISRSTLRRYCHRFGLNWKRFRKSLRNKRDQGKFDQAKCEIANVIREQHRDLYFFDESALTLRGVVPYGWQPIGERIEIPVTGGSYPSLQALGFESADGEVSCYLHTGSVTSSTVISVMQNFISELQRPATIVIDNASPHTSKQFHQAEDQWSKQGVEIYRLPPYSPELNRIERLWKRLKYQWMPVQAWETFQDMLDCATACLCNIGNVIHMPSLVEG